MTIEELALENIRLREIIKKIQDECYADDGSPYLGTGQVMALCREGLIGK